MGRKKSTSKARARKSSRRRRAMVLALAVASIVVFYVKGHHVMNAAARSPVARAISSPTPAPTPSTQHLTKPKARPRPRSPSASPSPSPSPTPDGPPFVLDAAPSCAGSTALIDIQLAATSKRPIVRLELLLDGAPMPMTPAPSYPLTQYAGRSSGHAAPSGTGQWLLRAIDKKGIIEAAPFPYACG